VLGLGLDMAGGARGWLRVGQAFGVLLLPGLGSAVPAPRFLGTQSPCAMQALTILFLHFFCFQEDISTVFDHLSKQNTSLHVIIFLALFLVFGNVFNV